MNHFRIKPIPWLDALQANPVALECDGGVACAFPHDVLRRAV
eukprot:SAG31_NODE_30509_length_380_cov_0.733096_1_plen_41_part_10